MRFLRRRRLLFLLFAIAVFVSLFATAMPHFKAVLTKETPVSRHGSLSVQGTGIVDKNGDPYQLQGISLHGITWDVGRNYITKDTFKTLRDEWGVNAVRLPLYTAEYNGYCNGGDKNTLKGLVDKGVTYATELGMYIVIDWHILYDNNPLTNMSESKLFFNEVSEKYKDHNNVIYEICNEPNGCSWGDIKIYANEIIPVIRENDPDAIIIVGTPAWSQLGAGGESNEVADNPLTGYSNIVYSLHFYAADSYHSKYLPDKLIYAIEKGIPVFVSEFGLSEADGHGRLDKEMAERWLKLLDSYSVSYFCWSLNNIDVSSALLAPGTPKVSGWSDNELSESGKWVRDYYLARSGSSENEVTAGTFKDTGGLWMEEAVKYLSERDIVNGTGGGYFQPGRNVTRAEFLTMLMRAVTTEKAEKITENFADVFPGTYYYDTVLSAKALGIVKGSGDNLFNPEVVITREDMLVMLYNAMDKSGMLPDVMTMDWIIFPDWEEVSDYAGNPIQVLAKLRLVTGTDDGTLNPKGNATRAEAAQIIYRLLTL